VILNKISITLNQNLSQTQLGNCMKLKLIGKQKKTSVEPKWKRSTNNKLKMTSTDMISWIASYTVGEWINTNDLLKKMYSIKCLNKCSLTAHLNHHVSAKHNNWTSNTKNQCFPSHLLIWKTNFWWHAKHLDPIS